MKRIIIGLSPIFVAVGLSQAWAVPTAELLEPGELTVMETSHIAKAIQFDFRYSGKSFNADRTEAKRHLKWLVGETPKVREEKVWFR